MKRGVILALGLLLLIVSVRCNEDPGTVIQLQPPTVSSITPNEVSRAEKGIATVVGTNFSGATLVFLGNGVTIEKFTVINATTIEVHFAVNTNASSGKRPVQVTTPVGTGTTQDLLEVLDNRAPLSRINVDPNTGATNTVYTFDGLLSDDPDGNITKFEFEFGDGKKANGPVVTHKFTTVGSFDITMTVTDDDGAQGIATLRLKVKEGIAPTAKIVIQPKQGDVNTTYTFSGTDSFDPDGTILRHSWDFGNGNTDGGPVVSFHFSNPGVFHVSLIVTDNDGLQNISRKDVTVGAFDSNKAADEIRDIIIGFFNRYSDIQGNSAEEIVVDWSTSPNCPGRAHEIDIINNQKQIIERTRASVGAIDVTFDSFSRAHAIAPADFAWTNFDGTDHTGFAVHNFELVFEQAHNQWLICDFSLI